MERGLSSDHLNAEFLGFSIDTFEEAGDILVGFFLGAFVAPIWRYRMAEREQTRSHRSAKMRVIFLFHSAIRILN